MKIKDFKGKYDVIVETAITRFEMGGILSGDLVKFRKDVLKNDKVKVLTDQYKAMIQDAMNSDLNLRVSAIKSIRPTTSGYYGGGQGSGTRSPTDHYVDIVVEYAPGLWRNPMTVPIEVLEVVDTNGNLAPVPDSLKRKNKVEMPKEVESTDDDRSLPNTNKKPDFENKTTDGRTQISKAKEVKTKNQGKLTLEDVYGGMVSGDTNDKPARFSKYVVKFGEPYGKNGDDVIKRIQAMPGLSSNMGSKFSDDNTLNLTVDGDIEPTELEHMINNIVKGTVEVTKDEGEITQFEPSKNSVVVGGSSPSVGATA